MLVERRVAGSKEEKREKRKRRSRGQAEAYWDGAKACVFVRDRQDLNSLKNFNEGLWNLP
jgi:hypothetical protein